MPDHASFRSAWKYKGELLLLIGLSVVAGCGERPSASGSAARPNVIFILVDTLRADRLGCYGRQGNLSPWMDEIAEEGVLFERTIAESSWTLPSVASLFSGLYPSVHKVTSYQDALDIAGAPGSSVRYFNEQFTTLAETLQAHGYVTAGFSANPFITEKLGFAQGFDHFDSSFAANETLGHVVNEAALRWLAQRDKSKPFFLYLHYMDVHDPYKAGDEYVEPLVDAIARLKQKTPLPRREMKRHSPFFTKSARAYLDVPKHRALFACVEYWRARYDAGVPQINDYLNRLRTQLDEMDLWDDTYVIITADHGESLGEHGLWAHGLSAHQDQLHVPLILRWPKHLPAKRRITQTVRLFDVMPTLLEQLNIPTAEPLQAHSLVGLLRGDTTETPPALAEAIKQKPQEKALVVAQWKLLADLDEPRFELYNLDDDPTEQKDLATEFPERVATLRRQLMEQLAVNDNLGASVEVSETRLTAVERERLKDIGYIDDENETPDLPGESQPTTTRAASQSASQPTSQSATQPSSGPTNVPKTPNP